MTRDFRNFQKIPRSWFRTFIICIYKNWGEKLICLKETQQHKRLKRVRDRLNDYISSHHYQKNSNNHAIGK